MTDYGREIVKATTDCYEAGTTTYKPNFALSTEGEFSTLCIYLLEPEPEKHVMATCFTIYNGLIREELSNRLRSKIRKHGVVLARDLVRFKDIALNTSVPIAAPHSDPKKVSEQWQSSVFEAAEKLGAWERY